MCDIGGAGYNPPDALKSYVAPPIIHKPQLFSHISSNKDILLHFDKAPEVTEDELS